MRTASYKGQSAVVNNTTVNYASFQIDSQTTVGFMAIVTGTPTTMTVKLQVSCDGVTWADAQDTTATKTAIAAAGNVPLSIPLCGFNFVRPVAINGATAATVQFNGFAKSGG